MLLSDYANQVFILENLFTLQSTTNYTLSGPSWIYGKTRDGLTINWELCLVDEIMELINSVPWKHWTDINKEIDTENIKIELVDILHFIISEVMSKYNSKDVVKQLANSSLLTDIMGVVKVGRRDITTKNIKTDTVISYSMELLRCVVNKHNAIELLKTYFKLIKEINDVVIQFNLVDVYRLFLGKAVLNRFRYNHGYKDGTYKKLWNGVEDNKYIIDLVSGIDNELLFKPLTSSKLDTELYSKLEEKYKEV